LRISRVSAAIRRFVHSYRLSWAGTSWRGTAGQGPAISHETGSRLTGFSYVYKYLLVPQVELIAISSASTTSICIPVCCAQQEGVAEAKGNASAEAYGADSYALQDLMNNADLRRLCRAFHSCGCSSSTTARAGFS
jgi:hypothetical protein